MTHTPGPFWAEGPDEFGDYNILHKGNSLAVAAVVSNMRAPRTVKAYADLLAAAPDLLGALEAAIRELDECCFELNGENYNNPKFNAAIAKAKGE